MKNGESAPQIPQVQPKEQLLPGTLSFPPPQSYHVILQLMPLYGIKGLAANNVLLSSVNTCLLSCVKPTSQTVRNSFPINKSISGL